MNNFLNILLVIIYYLIGAIPTAYLFYKKSHNQDITKTGSRNVGATNLYELTQSRKKYLYVMILDVLKGAIPILIAIKIFDYHGFYLFIFGIALVFGHNYSIFIKLQGGKGLATSAGVNLVLFPIAVPVWLMLYYVSKRAITKNQYIAALIATFGIPVFILSTPSVVIHYFLNLTHIVQVEYWEFILFNIVIAILISSKHYRNFKDIISNKIKKIKESKNV